MSWSYKEGTPDDYVCSECSKRGVRLYRGYSSSFVELRCTACALKDQKRSEPDQPSACSIGWLVAAVPTEDDGFWWGYTSVPDAGVNWWNSLPTNPKEQQPCAAQGEKVAK